MYEVWLQRGARDLAQPHLGGRRPVTAQRPAPGAPDPAPHTWTRRPPCSLRAISGDSASGGLRRLEPAATRRLHSSILGPGSTLQTAVHFLFENTGERKSERVGRVEGGAPTGARGGRGGCGLRHRCPPSHGGQQALGPATAAPHELAPQGPGLPLPAAAQRAQPFRFQPSRGLPSPHVPSLSTARFLPVFGVQSACVFLLPSPPLPRPKKIALRKV